jgi:hypothetical protein
MLLIIGSERHWLIAETFTVRITREFKNHLLMIQVTYLFYIDLAFLRAFKVTTVNVHRSICSYINITLRISHCLK